MQMTNDYMKVVGSGVERIVSFQRKRRGMGANSLPLVERPPGTFENQPT